MEDAANAGDGVRCGSCRGKEGARPGQSCLSRRRTRPMNRSASRTPRPELPAWQADPSRTPRSTGALAEIRDFRRMALPDRPASDRVSKAGVQHRSAKRPGGRSRPQRSLARRSPARPAASVPRSPTAPVAGNNRAASRHGRPANVARAHRNSHQERLSVRNTLSSRRLGNRRLTP